MKTKTLIFNEAICNTVTILVIDILIEVKVKMAPCCDPLRLILPLE